MQQNDKKGDGSAPLLVKKPDYLLKSIATHIIQYDIFLNENMGFLLVVNDE